MIWPGPSSQILVQKKFEENPTCSRTCFEHILESTKTSTLPAEQKRTILIQLHRRISFPARDTISLATPSPCVRRRQKLYHQIATDLGYNVIPSTGQLRHMRRQLYPPFLSLLPLLLSPIFGPWSRTKNTPFHSQSDKQSKKKNPHVLVTFRNST